jgi:hypothetical protein
MSNGATVPELYRSGWRRIDTVEPMRLSGDVPAIEAWREDLIKTLEGLNGDHIKNLQALEEVENQKREQAELDAKEEELDAGASRLSSEISAKAYSGANELKTPAMSTRIFGPTTRPRLERELLAVAAREEAQAKFIAEEAAKIREAAKAEVLVDGEVQIEKAELDALDDRFANSDARAASSGVRKILAALAAEAEAKSAKAGLYGYSARDREHRLEGSVDREIQRQCEREKYREVDREV